MRQLSQPTEDHLGMEMCESLLKADFDEGTEQIPVVRDPTPPPFNFPKRHVKTPVSFSHDHNISTQNESDFAPAEEDESLLRDVRNGSVCGHCVPPLAHSHQYVQCEDQAGEQANRFSARAILCRVFDCRDHTVFMHL